MRILNIGDSFSIGFNISQENFFGYQLEYLLSKSLFPKKVEVLNSEISLWRAKCDLVRSSFEILSETGELHTESLGFKPTAPQYKYIEIVAPPLPSPFSVINPRKLFQ